jgi:hypothetical protein
MDDSFIIKYLRLLCIGGLSFTRGGTQRNILKNIYAHFKALCI